MMCFRCLSSSIKPISVNKTIGLILFGSCRRKLRENGAKLFLITIYVVGRNSDKDPNRPKRAQSAYFIFMGDFREKCKRTGEADTSNVSSSRQYTYNII